MSDIGWIEVDDVDSRFAIERVQMRQGDVHLLATTVEPGTWTLREGVHMFALIGVDGALLERGRVRVPLTTRTTRGHITLDFPLRITEVGCHYCYGDGYTTRGDDSGTWREPCPACSADD